MRSLPLLAAAALAIIVAPAAAQDPAAPTSAVASGPVLSLDDAHRIAARNNPDYQRIANDRRPARAALTSAYASLLPSADVSFRSSFQKGGEQIFSGVSLGETSDILQSQYALSLNYRLNSATITNPRYQRANLDAIHADIAGAAELLRASVTQQYLNVLQATARAELQDSLVVQARRQLDLARTRAAVGSATQLDVRRAEVALGQAEVNALREHNNIEIEKLRLFQQMGVAQPDSVRLVSTFTVTPPPFALDSVLQLARRQNPTLTALVARENAARWNVRRQLGEYSPTLSVNTGWSGYTREQTNVDLAIAEQRDQAVRSRASCFTTDSLRTGAGLPSIAGQCATIDFTPAMASAVRDENDQYPFNFTRSPWTISAMVSFPLFDGLSREARLEEAQAFRADARHAIRAQELTLTANVTGGYRNLVTAARAVELQELNAAKAREELAFAEERYRVGQGSFLEVTDARTSYERAQSERITAIYEYHKAFAALESAVGRPLR